MTSAKEDLCASEKFEPGTTTEAAVSDSPPCPADTALTPLRRGGFRLAGCENSLAQLLGAAFAGAVDVTGSLTASASRAAGFPESLLAVSLLTVLSATWPFVAAGEICFTDLSRVSSFTFASLILADSVLVGLSSNDCTDVLLLINDTSDETASVLASADTCSTEVPGCSGRETASPLEGSDLFFSFERGARLGNVESGFEYQGRGGLKLDRSEMIGDSAEGGAG